MGFVCGNRVFDSWHDIFFGGVSFSPKLSILLQKRAPLVFLIKKSVLVVHDLIQSWCLILNMIFAPPYLANIKCVRSLYIIPSLPLSFKTFLSCSQMPFKYAFF